jgi:S-layer protein
MALTATQSKSMYQFFALAFNAAPGVTYMNQLDAAINSGMSVTQVVEQFTTKAEFTSTYPSFLSNEAFATRFINNNVGSTATDAAKTAAINDVAAALNAGWSRGKTITQVFTNISGLAETDATWGNFVKSVNNKVAYAQYYTETMLGGAEATPVLATLRAVIANVTPTTSVVVADMAAVLNPAPVPVAQTFTLTTGVDAFTGGAGNDTFNATNANLNAFDAIAGGAGTDTLNYADSSAANFGLPPSLTISGMETVNVSRLATGGGTGAFAITNTTFGTGVTSLTYTDSSLAASMTGATASVTLNSATSVAVSSPSTGVFTTVAVTDTSTTAASTGSTLKTVSISNSSGNATITGNGVTTLNLNAAVTGGTATVTAAAGARALAINASGTTTQGAVTDAQATSAVVTVSGAQTLGLVTVAKATEVTINTNAAATTSISAAVATKLNLGGTNLNTLTVNAATVAATSVVITGAGGVAADLTPITALTSVDTTGSTAAVPASGALTGANTLTIGTGVAYAGGAGQDIVTVGATTKAVALGDGDDTVVLSVTALGTGGSIAGGNGTDVLRLSNANAVTLSTAGATQTAFKAAVTGFETLDITTQTASTINVTGAGAFSTIKMTTADALQTFTGVTSGQTIELVWGADVGTAGNGVAINTLTGPADAITLKLGGDLSGGVRVFGDTYTLTGMETVNIVAADTNATFTTRLATITVADAQAQVINISGNNGVALTHAGTALYTLNAGGLTKGAVTFTSGALTTDATVTGSVTGGDTLNFANALGKVTMTATAGTNALTGSSTAASTITGGSGADTITGGAAADTLVGGAGNDTVRTRAAGTATAADKISGGAGVDTFELIGSVASATAYTGAANVSDFVVGTDIMALSATLTNYVAGAGTIQGGVAAAAAGATGIQTVAQNAAGAAYTAGADLIKLTTGVAFTTSVQATFNAAIGTASVTGLGAGRDIFASYYDTASSKAVFLAVNSSAGTNTIVETGDVVTLIGTVDMTAADYAVFNNASFAIVA